MRYFTSDHHFFHRGIIRNLSPWGFRDFQSVEEMNETLIQHWNQRVSPTDIVYHLGDFFFNKVANFQDALQVLDKLNGDIILIQGNHDYIDTWDPQLISRFKEIHTRTIIKIQDVDVILDHYPLYTWLNKCHGSVHLHGHTHDTLNKTIGRFDVSVDTYFNIHKNYGLFNENQILELTNQKQHQEIINNYKDNSSLTIEQYLIDSH